VKITFLGTGTSCGVPLPTCTCEVCNSSDPKDNRLRCSALVETDEGKQILVDCGPDFRIQALRAKIMHLDALLVTHNHFDHVAGLDDLRAYCNDNPLPIYADPIVSRTLKSHYDYIFVHRYPGTPKLELNELVGNETFQIGATKIQPIQIFHGQLPIFAWRIGKLAYITDCTEIRDSEWEKLKDVDTLVIDALRWNPHPTHYSVEQALEVVNRIKPRQTYFTHMSHDMGLHSVANTKFPAGVQLAYDGLSLEF